MVQSADSADWPCVGEGALGGCDVPELPEAAAAEEMMGAEGRPATLMRMTAYRDPMERTTVYGMAGEEVWMREVMRRRMADNPVLNEWAAACKIWREERRKCGCGDCLAELRQVPTLVGLQHER